MTNEENYRSKLLGLYEDNNLSADQFINELLKSMTEDQCKFCFKSIEEIYELDLEEKFYGIFVGINEFESDVKDFKSLGCAKNDALSLYKFFNDNKESTTNFLLIDHNKDYEFIVPFKSKRKAAAIELLSSAFDTSPIIANSFTFCAYPETSFSNSSILCSNSS